MMADTLNLLLAKNMPTSPAGIGGGAVGAGETLQVRKDKKKENKRSKDLGALLDSCSRDDLGNFLQTCIKKITTAN